MSTGLFLSRRTMLLTSVIGLLCATRLADAEESPLAIKVYKDPFCGCCGAWIEHIKANGFAPEVDSSRDLTFVHKELGVPDEVTSCHVGTIDGYFIEGHVPAADIKRLLLERLDARGLAVPGMPIGSPGMEVEGQPPEAYDVLLVAKDGTTTVFAHHG
jgi:hypothetical protein